MNAARERWALRVMSGEDRSPPAMLLRAGLLLVEPFYASAMLIRNKLYDKGVFATHPLERPTIAVGNLTTGGTGKTPMVRWLAEQVIAQNLRPAILMRGYRSSTTAGGSDEQRMLMAALGERAIVIAFPNRRAGAALAMTESPPPDVFLLDDAFQHRRVARDFNLLLISATNPFGYGHVLPRGLLREPVSGLRRADAIVITRANLASAEQLAEIEQKIRRHRDDVPIFHADHIHAALRTADDQTQSLDELRNRKFFLFTGIADPRSLQEQLNRHSNSSFAGAKFFADHHAFTDDDLLALRRAATASGAHTLLTTEKDWIKIASLATAHDGLPIMRLELELRFREGGGGGLMDLILARLNAAPAESPSTTGSASSENRAAEAP